MNHSTKKYIQYLFCAGHRKGHGIHSPYLFRLITEVIENKGFFSAYPLLTAAEVNVRNMLKLMDAETYQQLYEARPESATSLTRKLHLLPVEFNRLIFRLVNDFCPATISFFGSTFGVTLLAMALADRRIQLEAQVENSHYRSFCRRLVEEFEVTNIQLSCDGECTASDFIVVQNPLDAEYCNKLLVEILAQSTFGGLVVLCGIHTSEEMEAVWIRHKRDQMVRISLDLFEIGILICRKGLQKEDFVLRF